MISFVPTTPREDEPGNTVLCLELQYGDLCDTDSHIAILRVGVVPFTMFPKRGWVWLSFLRAPGVFRGAREALRAFWDLCDWELIATATPGRNARFLEFCGFRRVGEHEGAVIFERTKWQ